MKEFRSSAWIFGTAFDATSLNHLENAIKESDEEGLKIWKIRIVYDEGSVEVDSFSELTEEDIRSFSGKPSYVEIAASGRRDDFNEPRYPSVITRSVSIDVHQFVTHLYVNGADSTWVFGKKAALLRLLKRQRKLSVLDVLSGILILTVYFAGLSFFRSLSLGDNVWFDLVYVIGSPILFAFGLMTYIQYMPSRIALKEQRGSTFRWDSLMNGTTLLVGIAALIVAILQYLADRAR